MFDAKKIMNGSFVKLYHNGDWIATLKQAELTININKEEVLRSGTRSTGYKTTSWAGEGSFTLYKTSNRFTDLIAQITDDTLSPYVTSLTFEENDPESDEKSNHVITDVQFDTLPILASENGALMEQEYQFTFSGYKRK